MGEYQIGPVGTGIVAGTLGADTLTGTGTEFETQFIAGDTVGVILADGSHVRYTVDSVDSDTQITLTGNLAQSFTGRDYYGLRAAKAFISVVGQAVAPKSTPQRGAERAQTGTGVSVWRGYARTTWRWAGVTVTQATALRAYVLSGAESGRGYIQTRDADDAWAFYAAIVDFPDTAQLSRWSGVYQEYVLTFILLEAV